MNANGFNAANQVAQSFYEGNAVRIADRITKDDGSVIVQADITSLTYWIHKIASDGTATQVETGSLTVSAVWFNTLVLDAAWPDLVTGYNFMYRFASTNLTAVAGLATNYDIHVRGTLTDGTKFWGPHVRISIAPLFHGTET